MNQSFTFPSEISFFTHMKYMNRRLICVFTLYQISGLALRSPSTIIATVRREPRLPSSSTSLGIWRSTDNGVTWFVGFCFKYVWWILLRGYRFFSHFLWLRLLLTCLFYRAKLSNPSNAAMFSLSVDSR
jgi:hypothetical protein